MNKDELVLSTKKSLYKPIEITIDEQVYQSAKITHSVLKELNKLDKEVVKGEDSDEPTYKAIQLIFNVDRKVLEELDNREVGDIYFFLKRKFSEIDKERAKLAAETIGKIWGPTKQKAKEKIPSRKRPGNKQ